MPSEQLQILLVEGDPVDARRMAQMLRTGGLAKFRLRRVYRLREAKRHLQNNRADYPSPTPRAWTFWSKPSKPPRVCHS
jgi:hypothetical protein